MAMRPAFVSNSSGSPHGVRSRGGAGAAGSDVKKKTDFKRALPAAWALMRPRRWMLLGGFLLMVPNRICGLSIPFALRYLIDRVMTPHNLHPLPLIIGCVVAATVVQGITSYALTQMLSKAAQRLIAELRVQVQAHVGRLSVAYYDANRTGALVSRIMSDVEGVRNLLGTGLVELLGGILTAVIAFGMMVRISATMTGIAALVLLVFGSVLSMAFTKIRPIFRQRAKINAEVTGRLTESLGGVRVVKGYHAEERESGVFAEGVGRLLSNVISTLTAQSVMSLASTLVLGIVGVAVMFIGAHLVVAGRLTLGGFMSYNAFLAFLIAPVFQIVAIGTQVTEAFAGLDRTQEILGETAENADPRRTETMPPINGLVEFRDVEFAYEADKPVLHGISFVSQPGTVTALVGSSGSGKSTIISLVCAFHTPDKGAILVDDYDLSRVELYSYRSQLGVVLQESFLFDGSIRENVAFSHPGATEAQVLDACRIARVDEFAERFPEGYDTIVGERGVKLSGGQRQRIAIARAILADPRILILDEATSSLDSESEELIQSGLSFLMQGRTTFVIAHRLSTIRRANQILVVEGGNIVERGNHDELLAMDGRYRELYLKQHHLESNLFLAPGEGDKLVEV